MTQTQIKRTILVLICLLSGVINVNAANNRKTQILFEVDLGALVRMMSNNPNDSQLNHTLMLTNTQRALSKKDYLELFETIYHTNYPKRNLSYLFVRKNEYDIKINSTNKVVINSLKKEADRAVMETATRMSFRLNAAGINNADIKMNANKGIIKITLDSVADSSRLVHYLSTKGELGIYEVYNNEDLINNLFLLNDRLAKQPAYKSLKVVPPPFTTPETEQFLSNNPLFTILFPSIDDSNQLLPGPVIGRALFSEKNRLISYFNTPAAHKILPENTRIVNRHRSSDKDTILVVYVIKIPKGETASVSNNDIIDAWSEKNIMNPNEYTVTLKMNQPGTKNWSAMTDANKGRYIAVLYDEEVYSCPKVLDGIHSGMTQIAAHFTQQQAEEIAHILKIGQLPLPVQIMSKQCHFEVNEAIR